MKKTLLTAIILSFAIGVVSPVESAWNPFAQKKKPAIQTAAKPVPAKPAPTAQVAPQKKCSWGISNPFAHKASTTSAITAGSMTVTVAVPPKEKPKHAETPAIAGWFKSQYIIKPRVPTMPMTGLKFQCSVEWMKLHPTVTSAITRSQCSTGYSLWGASIGKVKSAATNCDPH